MELRPLCVMILIILLIPDGKADEKPKPTVSVNPQSFVYTGDTVTVTCNLESHGWTFTLERRINSGSWSRLTENTGTLHDTVLTAGETEYRCIAHRGNFYSDWSDPVKITVTKPKPTVSVNPQSFIYTGDKVTVTCNLESHGWTFSWYRTINSGSQTRSAENTKTLHDTVSTAGETEYQCIAHRINDNSDWSDPVKITVKARPKPVVSIEPDDRVHRGETATLRCEIQDEQDFHWSFSWNKDGVAVSNEQKYSISDVESSHAGKYTCSGGEAGGSRASHPSDAVTLTVSGKPKPELTPLSKEPLLKGNSVTLFCSLMLRSAGWKFYWIKPTQSTETETETETGAEPVTYFNRISSSIRVSEGGRYKCRAGRGNPVYYTHYSDALWVNVTENLKAVVRINPDTHVFRGETVTLRCEIQGGGDTEWTYSWRKTNRILQHTTQEINLRSVRNDDGGKYTCRGRRKSDYQFSELSDAVTLTVSDPAEAVVSVSPLNWLTEGDSVTLSCEVKHSSTGWTFSWYGDVLHRNSAGFLGDTTALLSDSSRGSGGSYTLSPVTLKHSGLYVCRAERGEPAFHTQYSKPHPLWITGESPPVSLIISPSRTQHFIAHSLSLSCGDQRDSPGWTVRGWTHTETRFDCSSVSGPGCDITSLSTSHTGVYWCESESGGRSNPVNITVHDGHVILDSPVHPVPEGDSLTLRCLYRNTKISPGSVFFKNDSLLQTSQTSGEMIVLSVSKSDEGFYHCKHPEGQESPKSWVSVTGSEPGSGKTVLAVGLILSLLVIIVFLVLLWRFRFKKGTDRDVQQNISRTPGQNPSPSGADTQSGYIPLQSGDVHLYSTVGDADVAAAELSESMYAQVTKKKMADGNKAAEASDVMYSVLDLKPQKKTERKQVKVDAEPETLYSELKHNTSK